MDNAVERVVIHRPGTRCWYCGVQTRKAETGYLGTHRTRDHVVPAHRTRGKSTDPANLVCACRSCNQGLKGPQDLETFRAHLRAAYPSWDGTFHGEVPTDELRPFAPIEVRPAREGA